MSRRRESVWEYPRPPRVEKSEKKIRVVFDGETVAETTKALRILETSHPPTYYIPLNDIRSELLIRNKRRTLCEWKGEARYYDLRGSRRTAVAAAWEYAEPEPGYEMLRGHLAFYAAAMEACYVGNEQVDPQNGSFYGGWITSEIEGPFKGGPGTGGW